MPEARAPQAPKPQAAVPEPRGLDRAEQLARARGHFQVVVIGGGITGAGIAWDCALRGLSTALLERTDFAAGTSSASSKMVHAGLRYMVNDPELVREASSERQRLFRACPHLAWPMEFLLPAYGDTPEYDAHALPAVLERYDELAGCRNTARGRMLDPRSLLADIPGLRGSPLAVGSYWDGMMDDARFTLAVARSAAEAGAVVLNHAPVTGFLRDCAGRVRGVRFRDEDPGGPRGGGEPGELGEAGELGELTADAVVLAAGVFTDLLLREAGEERSESLRPSKGMHLVFRSELTGGRALVVPVGGNVLYFLVPFRPGYLAMGCTDTDYPVRSCAELDHVPTTEEEVELTLGILDKVLPGVFGREQVAACYAGVRPLVRPAQEPGRPLRALSESDTSRTHRIWRAAGGVWVIAGGKFTTFRLMAEQLVDAVASDLQGRGLLRSSPPCLTSDRRCHGAPALAGGPEALEGWLARATPELAREAGLPLDCARHLASAYGTDAPFVRAEIHWAVEQEMCRSASDFLARRTQLRFVERMGLDVLDAVVEELGRCLGWGAELRRRQAEEYREHLRRVAGPAGLA
jgi:glycerol-3-phosphate dehydrogenase